MWLEYQAGRTPLTAHRPMFPWEVRAGVDFAGIDKAISEAQSTTAASLDAVRDRVLQELSARLATATSEADVGAKLTEFLISQPPAIQQIVLHAKATISQALARLHNTAQKHVAAEAVHQGVTPPTLEPAAAGDYEALAKTAPESIWPKIAQAAVQANGSRPADVQQITTAAQGASIKDAQDLARQSTNVANAQGRLSAIQAMPEPAQIYASELLDSATCDPCAEIDGTNFDSLDEALTFYPDGGVYAQCDGGDRCRGTLVVVYASEDNPVADGSSGPAPEPEPELPAAPMFEPEPTPVPDFTPTPPPEPVAVEPVAPQPVSPSPAALARAERAALRKTPETELEERLSAAYADDTEAGQALVDKLEAEFARRDDARALREAKAAARADAKQAAAEVKQQAQSDEINRLMAEEGYGPLDATHTVMGGSYDKLLKEATMGYLRENYVVTTGNYAKEVEAAYHTALHAELERVEQTTMGADLRNEAGVKKDIDVMRLFWSKDDAFARRYAAPELKEYWDQNGRMTLDSFKETLRQQVTGEYRRAEAGEDYYQ
jgi:guanyl-specific ribonuclease Sa